MFLIYRYVHMYIRSTYTYECMHVIHTYIYILYLILISVCSNVNIMHVAPKFFNTLLKFLEFIVLFKSIQKIFQNFSKYSRLKVTNFQL